MTTELLKYEQQKKSAVVATLLNVLWFGMGSIYCGNLISGLGSMITLMPLMVILSMLFPPLALVFFILIIIESIGTTKKANVAILEEL